MTKKLKFGGISFGGKKPYVRIFGRTHKMAFGRDKKEKKYGFKVEKKTRKDFFLRYFYLLFVLYDVFFYFVFNPPKFISDATEPIASKFVQMSNSLGGLYVPSWVAVLILFVYVFSFYYVLYLLIFRGVRTWHGTEHKVISAAENEDLDNAKKYNPIHERCGGTLLPTIFFAYITFLIFYTYTGIPYGVATFTAILIFLNVKFFHKYDKIGIWFGKKFQKYVSISEPLDWQLELGSKAMKELVKAEKGEKYIDKAVVFLEKDLKVRNVVTKRQLLPALFILFTFLIIFTSIAFAPKLASTNFITEKYVTFSGLPGDIKTDYVLIQINTTEDTLPVDRIRLWGLFEPRENVTYDDTLYDNLSLSLSVNNGTRFFINETEHEETPKYWLITDFNYSFMPIKEKTVLNLTFSFLLPNGDYNESYLFNYTPIIRFTSYVRGSNMPRYRKKNKRMVNKGRTCLVRGCNFHAIARGYCINHYNIYLKEKNK